MIIVQLGALAVAAPPYSIELFSLLLIPCVPTNPQFVMCSCDCFSLFSSLLAAPYSLSRTRAISSLCPYCQPVSHHCYRSVIVFDSVVAFAFVTIPLPLVLASARARNCMLEPSIQSRNIPPNTMGSVNMTTTTRYVFFIGSTDTHQAHSDPHATDVLNRAGLPYDIQHARGVWEDEHEDTAVIAVHVESDSRALMLAHSLSVATGNDCVLVSRDSRASDDAPFNSLRRNLVTWQSATTGNRTISGSGDSRTEGRYVPDIRGNVVAWLVWRDSVTVSPIAGN